jgi:hypothetical protein
MHKTNSLIIALVLTVIIGGTLTFFDTLHRSDVIGIFYFPVFLLSVVLSGGGHNVTATAVWSSFIAYTLLYLLIFILVYALVCEMVLLRRGFPHLQKYPAEKNATDELPTTAISDFGRAVHAVEQSRRGHWVLKNVQELDLSEADDLIGARAIVSAPNLQPTKGLIRELHRRITSESGAAAANAAIEKLKVDAATVIRAHSQNVAGVGPAPSPPTG